jgi:hypothetical protein
LRHPAPAPSPHAPRGWQAVFVDLRADNPRVRIDRVIDGEAIAVCAAPCSRVLDRSGVYIIEGDGVTPTARFVFPDDENRVTLDVHAGSWGRKTLGNALAIAGGLAALLGLEVAGDENLSLPDNSEENRATIGLVMLAIGIPVVLTGLYLSSSARTSVASSTGATFSDERPPPRKRPVVALTPRGLEF